MDFNIPTVQSHAAALGFDAISTYALPGGTNEVIQSILYEGYFSFFDSLGHTIHSITSIS